VQAVQAVRAARAACVHALAPFFLNPRRSSRMSTRGFTGRRPATDAARRLPPRLSSFFLQAPLAPHVAGQHVDVRLTAPDGYRAQRSYSIASAPGDREIELAIERLDDGEVSPYFHAVAQPGDDGGTN
jgi:Oxidoreductase FAD-binding domain